MSFLLHAVLGLVLLGLVVGVGAAVAAFLVRRRVRRTWARMQDHVVTRGVLAVPSLVEAWRDRFEGRFGPEAVSFGKAASARRQMWIAIEDAERAVQHAASVDAPVGDLPAVCRSLRRAGEDLDDLLRVARRLPADRHRPDALQGQVAELIRAARDVQSVAVSACTEAAEPRLRSLVRDVGDEVQVVAAGLTRLRSFSR